MNCRLDDGLIEVGVSDRWQLEGVIRHRSTKTSIAGLASCVSPVKSPSLIFAFTWRRGGGGGEEGEDDASCGDWARAACRIPGRPDTAHPSSHCAPSRPSSSADVYQGAGSASRRQFRPRSTNKSVLSAAGFVSR